MSEMVLEGADALMKTLDALRPENPQMKKELRKMMRQALGKARKKMVPDARAQMKKDPRKAATAIRHSVYKRVLGGQVNILSSRKGVGKMGVTIKKTKMFAGKHGGNRRKRSARTNQLDGYIGKDRGFILRFINKGAYFRQIKPTPAAKRPNKGGFGYRGSIERTTWFASSARRALTEADKEFRYAVQDAIENIWKKK